jgi:hypothetical protein
MRDHLPLADRSKIYIKKCNDSQSTPAADKTMSFGKLKWTAANRETGL